MLHETPPPLDAVHHNSTCNPDNVHEVTARLLDVTAEGGTEEDELNDTHEEMIHWTPGPRCAATAARAMISLTMG